MNYAIKKSSLLLFGAAGLALGLSSECARAAVITQWTFNGSTPTSGTLASSGGTAVTAPGNSPLPTTGSGTAVTLGMTNPFNGGSQVACDYPSTSGTAVPSYTEYLWRVRANSSYGDGTPDKLPNGSSSKNGWAIFNISPGTANGRHSIRRESSWMPVPPGIQTSSSALTGTRRRRVFATCNSNTT